MKATIKIIFFTLIIAIGLGSFPAQIFSGTYTYREPVAIVDETIKKTGEQGLKKKLSRLEEALEAEVERQLAVRSATPQDKEGAAGGLLAQQPMPTEGLARIDAPATVPTRS
jgi:hypothetical protein